MARIDEITVSFKFMTVHEALNRIISIVGISEVLQAVAPDLLNACEVHHSKFGDVPDTLDYLAALLKTKDLHQNEKAWAMCLHRIAEQQRAAIAKARGQEVK